MDISNSCFKICALPRGQYISSKTLLRLHWENNDLDPAITGNLKKSISNINQAKIYVNEIFYLHKIGNHILF